MNRTKKILLCLVLLGSRLPEAGADSPRTAVLDFALARSPGIVDPAVLDFSRAVQAKLLASSEFTWVERQEFERLNREFALGSVNQSDPAAAVRLGHLLRADLILRGEIAPRSPGISDLTLEVVDLKRADVLATRAVAVSTSSRNRLHPTAAELDTTARAALEILTQARTQLDQVAGLRVLAPLYFKNTGKSDRLGFLEERLRKALGEAATSATGFRLLRFPEPAEAGEEAGMVLAGLTDTDPDAWQHVADAYVWGSFAEEGGDGMAFDEVPVTVSMHMWNGAGEAQEIKWTGAVKNLDDGLRVITSGVLGAAKAAPSRAKATGPERQQLAASLRKRASEVANGIQLNERIDFGAKGAAGAYLNSAAGRQQYAYWLRLLEVACFFDPLNRALQLERLQVAWAHASPFRPADTLRGQWLRTADFQLQARRFERLPDQSLDGYWPARQTELLADFVDLLGRATWKAQDYEVSQEELHRQLREVMRQWSRVLAETREAVARETKKPAWYAAQQRAWFQQAASLRHLRDPIIVRDALEQVWPVLENEFGRALRSGDSAKAEDWIAVIFSTYSCFGDHDRPTAMLDSAWRSAEPAAAGPAPAGAAQKTTASPALPRPEQPWAPVQPANLPPLPPQANDPKSPVLAASIREIDPRPLTRFARTKGGETSLFKKGRANALTVGALAWQDGKLWFEEDYEELPPALGVANPRGNFYLWSYDPALRTADLVTAKLGGHGLVRQIAGVGGAIWLGLDGDGVWRLDGTNGTVRRFKGEDGLQTARIMAAAQDRDNLYFLGGVLPDFFVSEYSIANDKWTGISVPMPPRLAESAKNAAAKGAVLGLQVEPQISACRDWVCFTSDWTTFFSRKTKQWVDLFAAPGTSSNLSNQRFSAASADEAGFYLGSEDQPGGPMPFMLTGGNQPGGPRLAMRGSPYPTSGTVLFIDPDRPTEKKSIQIPGRPVAMAHHGPWLWVVLDYPGAVSRLGLIDKRTAAFVGQIVLPGMNMRRVVATDSRVWVGGSRRTFMSGLWEDGAALLEVTLEEPRPAATTAATPQTPRDFPLLHAVWNGDLAAVDAVLAQKLVVDEAAATSWTALMGAAAAGRDDLVQHLLAAGANPNLLSRDGDSALQQAARRGDIKSARLLLQHGAKPNLHPSVKLRGFFSERRFQFLPVAPPGNAAVPRQPAGLKATVTAEGEVALSWEDRSDNEVGFEVLYTESDGRKQVFEYLPANATHWVDPRARSDATLTYSVRAFNDFNPYAGEDEAPMVRLARPPPSASVTRSQYGLGPGSAVLLPAVIVAESPLAAAAAGGHTAVAALLLENRADPNLEDAAGDSPLIYAARHRQYAMVRQLLAAGARPELANDARETAASIIYQWHEDEALLREVLAATPAAGRAAEASALLVEATRRGQVKDLEMLMDLGADLTAHNASGQILLSRVFSVKPSTVGLRLMQRQWPRLQEQWRRGWNHQDAGRIARAAISSDCPEAITQFLAAGLDVNLQVEGEPLVVMAAHGKAFAALALLVERGAKLEVTDRSGAAAKSYLSPAEAQLYLGVAPTGPPARPWPWPTAQTVMRAGPPEFTLTDDPVKAPANAALLRACQKGDLVAAIEAVAAGAQLDCYGPDGLTPLLQAFKAKAFDLVHWLVEEGASVNRASKKGFSPVAFAFDSGRPELVDYLLQAGADINACGLDGYPPLMIAIARGNRAAVAQLLDAGADSNLGARHGSDLESPLAMALRSGNTAAVTALLGHRANFRAQAYIFVEHSDGVRKAPQPSLLMHAAAGKDVALIKQMIAMGQNPLFVTGDGIDALAWAASAGSVAAVEFLLPLSAHKGRALEFALRGNHSEIAALLQRAGYQIAAGGQNPN